MPDSFINTFPSRKCYLRPKYNLHFYGIIWGKLIKLSWMKIYHPQSYTSFIIHTYAHSYYLIYLKNTATSILVVFPSFLLDHYLWGEQATIFEQLYEEGFMVRTWNLQLAPERMEALPKITSGSLYLRWVSGDYSHILDRFSPHKRPWGKTPS